MPFNIPVQRFGNLSLERPDFWGARIGTSQFANRTFGAIKPVWNPPLIDCLPSANVSEFAVPTNVKMSLQHEMEFD
jgi:hypothetical protein